jgi:hypothetical protein
VDCPQDEVSLLQTKSETRHRSASGDPESNEKNTDTKTGEIGEEIYHPMSHPSLYKVTFASKSAKALKADRDILKAQRDIDAMQMDARQSVNRLKAMTYHSAKAAAYRQGQLVKLQSQKRRMQLLATLNMQKADNSRAAAEEAKHTAFWEKQLHTSQEKTAVERALRRKIWKQESKDQEAFNNFTKGNANMSFSTLTNAISSNRRNVSSWEVDALANVTGGLKDAGIQDVVSGLSEKEAAAATKDFQGNYGAFLDIMGIGPQS